ncbi:hypothetical protein [Corynebacterium mucifaciens]|uniref:Gas vesicle protein n=1 Tax=Corynebacterium mucifaciens TaxID=57171 RepID=A0A7X6LSK5_9CORY|nr:hypothetical protein [Corynebacterium mucifaciens]NKY69099.1 hypothetical protein [Corynebacterium mucifaciens]
MGGTTKQTLSQEELKWMKSLHAIAPRVEEWMASWELLPDIEPGSALKGDEVDWLQPGHSAAYQIDIAAEHLHFSLSSLLSGQSISPTAHLTIGRTAYMTAFNAAWILAPASRKERQERAFRLKAKEVKESLSALTDFPVGKNWDEITNIEKQRLEDKRAQLHEIGQRIHPHLDPRKHQINQTDVIQEVAHDLFNGDSEEDQLIRSNMQQLWRMSSAAAHGYYHHSLTRVETPTEENGPVPPGMMLMSAKIDTDVGPLLFVAYLVLKRAIELYRQRCTNHLR